MGAYELIAASIVMAVGSTVQGSIGFGLNVVAAPILVLIDTALVPGPALLAAFALTVLMAVRDRGSIDRAGFGWLLVGRMPGTIAAALLVGILPERGIALALAIVVLIAVGMSLLGWHLRRTPANLAGVGVVSGVMGTLSSVGGPPVAMLYQDTQGAILRGTLSAIFVVGSIVSVASLALVGRFGSQELVASAALLPGVGIGFLISRVTAKVVDRRALRPAVLAVSAIASVVALVRYAF